MTAEAKPPSSWRTKHAAELTQLRRDIGTATGRVLRQIGGDVYSLLENGFASYLKENGKFVDRRPKVTDLIERHESDLKLEHNEVLMLMFIYIPMRNGISHRRLEPPIHYVRDFIELATTCLERLGVERDKPMLPAVKPLPIVTTSHPLVSYTKTTRVYQLAREFNVKSEVLIQALRHLGVPVTSHSSTVEERLQKQLRDRFNAAGSFW
jgi:hypothetical protein